MRLLLPTKKTQYYFMTNLYKIPLAIVINYYIFGDLCLTLFKTVINNFLFNKSQLTVNVMNLCAFRLNNLPCNAIYRDCSGQRRHLTPLCTSGTFPLVFIYCLVQQVLYIAKCLPNSNNSISQPILLN